KGKQDHLHRRGEVLRADGEVGSQEVGRGPDRGEDVVHKRKVEHLLHSDLGDGSVPQTHQLQSLGIQALALLVLHGERGIKISAHHHVLKGRGFTEHEDELLSILNYNLLLRNDRRHIQCWYISP